MTTRSMWICVSDVPSNLRAIVENGPSTLTRGLRSKPDRSVAELGNAAETGVGVAAILAGADCGGEGAWDGTGVEAIDPIG